MYKTSEEMKTELAKLTLKFPSFEVLNHIKFKCCSTSITCLLKTNSQNQQQFSYSDRPAWSIGKESKARAFSLSLSLAAATIHKISAHSSNKKQTMKGGAGEFRFYTTI